MSTGKTNHTIRNCFQTVVFCLGLVVAVGLVPKHVRADEVQGLVTSQDGEPIGNALVALHQRAEDKPLEKIVSHRVFTEKDGRFSVNDIDPGLFLVCVLTPGQNFLDPCRWSSDPPLIRVGDEKSAKIQHITLDRGKRIQLRLDDPKGLVLTPAQLQDEKQPENPVIVEPGVWTTGGAFQRMRFVSSDRHGHNFELVVPFDKDLRVSVDAHNARVFDDQGIPQTEASSHSFRAQHNKGLDTLKYRVAPVEVEDEKTGP